MAGLLSIPETYNRFLTSEPGDNAASSMKSVVADTSAYDWEGDAPLKQALCTGDYL